MQCILVRHGIAVEPDEWEGVEENRPLTEKGEKQEAISCQETWGA